MKALLNLCMGALSLSLVACGGGGGSSDVNSSFYSEITQSGKTYICRAQKAADACNNQSSKDCSACELKNSGTTNPGTTPSIGAITATCSTTGSSSTSYQVTQTGCILKLPNGDQTAVCNGTTLKMLTGTGFSKDKLLADGGTFSGGGLTINGLAIKCV